MPTSRRQFIKQGAGMVTLGLIMPSALIREARAQMGDGKRRILVIIQLAGGNDTFNTLVPYTDARYYSLRPMLSFQESELKDSQGRSMVISSEFGLHPAMSEIKDFYDAGKVAIVQGVGYPEPNLSHFLSMDIWHTADLSGLAGKGWLGRYADLALVGKPGLRAASFGGELPKSLSAENVVVPNILDFSLYNFLTDPNHPGDSVNQLNTFNSLFSRSFDDGGFAKSITGAGFDAVQSAAEVQAAVRAYSSSVVYPANNPLSAVMKMAAQIVTTVESADLLYVQMGGFDTHAAQIGQTDGGQLNKFAGDHARLLLWFSQAVKAFYDDLEEHGLADDVLMMQWSEFGRRPDENASFGTDHGTSGLMFMVGNRVQGGIYGEYPSLAAIDLDNAGNPRFNVDFREVYATILDRWLDVDSAEVLGAQYPNVGFLG
ncbi:MAG: DUF1501 domain-containing protein [Blastocatellia bacterium]|nr:DUF1501 domain-containing protein [Blastocatellia bacterium]